MTPDEVLKYCLETLDGTVLVNSWGEQGEQFPHVQRKDALSIWIMTFHP